MSNLPRKSDLEIGGKFRLIRKIGGGSYGEIYLALSISSGRAFAAKVESIKAMNTHLLAEARIHKTVEGGGGFGVPKVRWYGQTKDYNVLIMELLGPSLKDLFLFCGSKLSVKTVCMLADQMISLVEYVHSKDFIHRDIKPNNFVMGTGETDKKVFIIDFGLAKRYRRAKTKQHISFKDNRGLTGTARYVSINVHRGYEQSRRDDMEAMGYVFIYLLKGVLPWQNLKGASNKKQRYDQISEKKQTLSVKHIAKGLPPEFATYINYCRALNFEDTPDYAYCCDLWKNLLVSLNHTYDYVYDWTLMKEKYQQYLGRGKYQESTHQNEKGNSSEKTSSKWKSFLYQENDQESTNKERLSIIPPSRRGSKYQRSGRESTLQEGDFQLSRKSQSRRRSTYPGNDQGPSNQDENYQFFRPTDRKKSSQPSCCQGTESRK